MLNSILWSYMTDLNWTESQSEYGHREAYEVILGIR
jgi:hypothetical protein